MCKPCHDGPIQRAGLAALPKQPYSIPRHVGTSALPVTLVCGPPCAGKTTYVTAHRQAGDVVIDLDECIAKRGGRRWTLDKAERQAGFDLRNQLICDLQRPRPGSPRAWLIVAAPTLDERQAWCKVLGDVTIKMVVASKRTCLARLNADPALAYALRSLMKAIDWWFNKYEPAL